MSENEVKIIVAFISLAGSIITGVVTYLTISKKQAIQDAKREQSQKDSLNQIFNEMGGIKKRLDEHNHYAEKFAESSKNIAIIAERQATSNKAIEKLQKDVDYLKSDKCKI